MKSVHSRRVLYYCSLLYIDTLVLPFLEICRLFLGIEAFDRVEALDKVEAFDRVEALVSG